MAKSKFKKILKRTVIISAVAIVAIGGSGKLYANQKVKNYADKQQIHQVAQSLGANLSCMEKTKFNDYKFLAHNNGKPVYVTFEDCSEAVVENATKSLDHVFGIVGELNDKYKYEVVDDVSSSFFSDKTVIEYTPDELSNIVASTEEHSSLASLATSGQYNNRYTISYDTDSFATLTDQQQYSELLRQLCYAFQFSENTTFNSYANPDVASVNTSLLPNDINCLASVYAPKMDDSEIPAYVEKVKEITAPYEQQYYEKYVEGIDGYQSIDFKEFESLFVQFFVKDGNIEKYLYSLKVTGDTYKFGVFNSNKELMEKATGRVVRHNGTIIFENLNLKCGLSDSILSKTAYSSDLVFFKSSDGTYKLYDTINGVINCKNTIAPNEKFNEWFELTSSNGNYNSNKITTLATKHKDIIK